VAGVGIQRQPSWPGTHVQVGIAFLSKEFWS